MEPISSGGVISRATLIELSSGIASEAERDADRVAYFLDAFRSVLSEAHPELNLGDRWKKVFPARFLLELGAALRILEWENDGVIAPEMGLPPAEPTLLSVMSSVARAEDAPVLTRRVLRVFINHFAWNARSELGGSIALHGLDDDQLADRIAQFLFDHRHDLEAN